MYLATKFFVALLIFNTFLACILAGRKPKQARRSTATKAIEASQGKNPRASSGSIVSPSSRQRKGVKLDDLQVDSTLPDNSAPSELQLASFFFTDRFGQFQNIFDAVHRALQGCRFEHYGYNAEFLEAFKQISYSQPPELFGRFRFFIAQYYYFGELQGKKLKELDSNLKNLFIKKTFGIVPSFMNELVDIDGPFAFLEIVLPKFAEFFDDKDEQILTIALNEGRKFYGDYKNDLFSDKNIHSYQESSDLPLGFFNRAKQHFISLYSVFDEFPRRKDYVSKENDFPASISEENIKPIYTVSEASNPNKDSISSSSDARIERGKSDVVKRSESGVEVVAKKKPIKSTGDSKSTLEINASSSKSIEQIPSFLEIASRPQQSPAVEKKQAVESLNVSEAGKNPVSFEGSLNSQSTGNIIPSSDGKIEAKPTRPLTIQLGDCSFPVKVKKQKKKQVDSDTSVNVNISFSAKSPVKNSKQKHSEDKNIPKYQSNFPALSAKTSAAVEKRPNWVAKASPLVDTEVNFSVKPKRKSTQTATIPLSKEFKSITYKVNAIASKLSLGIKVYQEAAASILNNWKHDDDLPGCKKIKAHLKNMRSVQSGLIAFILFRQFIDLIQQIQGVQVRMESIFISLKYGTWNDDKYLKVFMVPFCDFFDKFDIPIVPFLHKATSIIDDKSTISVPFADEIFCMEEISGPIDEICGAIHQRASLSTGATNLNSTFKLLYNVSNSLVSSSGLQFSPRAFASEVENCFMRFHNFLMESAELEPFHILIRDSIEYMKLKNFIIAVKQFVSLGELKGHADSIKLLLEQYFMVGRLYHLCRIGGFFDFDEKAFSAYDNSPENLVNWPGYRPKASFPSFVRFFKRKNIIMKNMEPVRFEHPSSRELFRVCQNIPENMKSIVVKGNFVWRIKGLDNIKKLCGLIDKSVQISSFDLYHLLYSSSPPFVISSTGSSDSLWFSATIVTNVNENSSKWQKSHFYFTRNGRAPLPRYTLNIVRNYLLEFGIVYDTSVIVETDENESSFTLESENQEIIPSQERIVSDESSVLPKIEEIKPLEAPNTKVSEKNVQVEKKSKSAASQAKSKTEVAKKNVANKDKQTSSAPSPAKAVDPQAKTSDSSKSEGSKKNFKVKDKQNSPASHSAKAIESHIKASDSSKSKVALKNDEVKDNQNISPSVLTKAASELKQSDPPQKPTSKEKSTKKNTKSKKNERAKDSLTFDSDASVSDKKQSERRKFLAKKQKEPIVIRERIKWEEETEIFDKIKFIASQPKSFKRRNSKSVKVSSPLNDDIGLLFVKPGVPIYLESHHLQTILQIQGAIEAEGNEKLTVANLVEFISILPGYFSIDGGNLSVKTAKQFTFHCSGILFGIKFPFVFAIDKKLEGDDFVPFDLLQDFVAYLKESYGLNLANKKLTLDTMKLEDISRLSCAPEKYRKKSQVTEVHSVDVRYDLSQNDLKISPSDDSAVECMVAEKVPGTDELEDISNPSTVTTHTTSSIEDSKEISSANLPDELEIKSVCQESEDLISDEDDLLQSAADDQNDYSNLFENMQNENHGESQIEEITEIEEFATDDLSTNDVFSYSEVSETNDLFSLAEALDTNDVFTVPEVPDFNEVLSFSEASDFNEEEFNDDPTNISPEESSEDDVWEKITENLTAKSEDEDDFMNSLNFVGVKEDDSDLLEFGSEDLNIDLFRIPESGATDAPIEIPEFNEESSENPEFDEVHVDTPEPETDKVSLNIPDFESGEEFFDIPDFDTDELQLNITEFETNKESLDNTYENSMDIFEFETTEAPIDNFEATKVSEAETREESLDVDSEMNRESSITPESNNLSLNVSDDEKSNLFVLDESADDLLGDLNFGENFEYFELNGSLSDTDANDSQEPEDYAKATSELPSVTDGPTTVESSESQSFEVDEIPHNSDSHELSDNISINLEDFEVSTSRSDDRFDNASLVFSESSSCRDECISLYNSNVVEFLESKSYDLKMKSEYVFSSSQSSLVYMTSMSASKFWMKNSIVDFTKSSSDFSSLFNVMEIAYKSNSFVSFISLWKSWEKTFALNDADLNQIVTGMSTNNIFSFDSCVNEDMVKTCVDRISQNIHLLETESAISLKLPFIIELAVCVKSLLHNHNTLVRFSLKSRDWLTNISEESDKCILELSNCMFAIYDHIFQSIEAEPYIPLLYSAIHHFISLQPMEKGLYLCDKDNEIWTRPFAKFMDPFFYHSFEHSNIADPVFILKSLRRSLEMMPKTNAQSFKLLKELSKNMDKNSVLDALDVSLNAAIYELSRLDLNYSHWKAISSLVNLRSSLLYRTGQFYAQVFSFFAMMEEEGKELDDAQMLLFISYQIVLLRHSLTDGNYVSLIDDFIVDNGDGKDFDSFLQSQKNSVGLELQLDSNTDDKVLVPLKRVCELKELSDMKEFKLIVEQGYFYSFSKSSVSSLCRLLNKSFFSFKDVSEILKALPGLTHQRHATTYLNTFEGHVGSAEFIFSFAAPSEFYPVPKYLAQNLLSQLESVYFINENSCLSMSKEEFTMEEIAVNDKKDDAENERVEMINITIIEEDSSDISIVKEDASENQSIHLEKRVELKEEKTLEDSIGPQIELTEEIKEENEAANPQSSAEVSRVKPNYDFQSYVSNEYFWKPSSYLLLNSLGSSENIEVVLAEAFKSGGNMGFLRIFNTWSKENTIKRPVARKIKMPEMMPYIIALNFKFTELSRFFDYYFESNGLKIFPNYFAYLILRTKSLTDIFSQEAKLEVDSFLIMMLSTYIELSAIYKLFLKNLVVTGMSTNFTLDHERLNENSSLVNEFVKKQLILESEMLNNFHSHLCEILKFFKQNLPHLFTGFQEFFDAAEAQLIESAIHIGSFSISYIIAPNLDLQITDGIDITEKFGFDDGYFLFEEKLPIHKMDFFLLPAPRSRTLQVDFNTFKKYVSLTLDSFEMAKFLEPLQFIDSKHTGQWKNFISHHHIIYAGYNIISELKIVLAGFEMVDLDRKRISYALHHVIYLNALLIESSMKNSVENDFQDKFPFFDGFVNFPRGNLDYKVDEVFSFLGLFLSNLSESYSADKETISLIDFIHFHSNLQYKLIILYKMLNYEMTNKDRRVDYRDSNLAKLLSSCTMKAEKTAADCLKKKSTKNNFESLGIPVKLDSFFVPSGKKSKASAAQRVPAASIPINKGKMGRTLQDLCKLKSAEFSTASIATKKKNFLYQFDKPAISSLCKLFFDFHDNFCFQDAALIFEKLPGFQKTLFPSTLSIGLENDVLVPNAPLKGKKPSPPSVKQFRFMCDTGSMYYLCPPHAMKYLKEQLSSIFDITLEASVEIRK